MIGYLWRASKGYRLQPWRSPYLRWRIETYWGLEAAHITAGDFWRFVWQHRGELLRFLQWAARMDASVRGRRSGSAKGVSAKGGWAIAPDSWT